MFGVLVTSSRAGVSVPNGGGLLEGGGESAMNLSVLVMAVMVTVSVLSAYAGVGIVVWFAACSGDTLHKFVPGHAALSYGPRGEQEAPMWSGARTIGVKLSPQIFRKDTGWSRAVSNSSLAGLVQARA